MKRTDGTQEDLDSLRKLIFEYTEGRETRLRMLVSAIRQDGQSGIHYPKAVYTDIIEEIYSRG